MDDNNDIYPIDKYTNSGEGAQEIAHLDDNDIQNINNEIITKEI